MNTERTISAFVDRFEENIAVLIAENQEIVIPRVFIPADAAEGSILHITIAYVPEETTQAKEHIQELIDRIGDAWES